MVQFPDVERASAQRERDANANIGPNAIFRLAAGMLVIVVIGSLIFMMGESFFNFAASIAVVAVIAIAVVMVHSAYKNAKSGKKNSYVTWHENIQEVAMLTCPDNIKDHKIMLTGQKGFGGVTLGRIMGYIRFRDNTTEVSGKAFINGIFYIAEKDKVKYLIPFLRPFVKINNVFFYDVDVYGKDLIGDVALTGVSVIPVGKWNFLNTVDVSTTDITKNITTPGVAIQVAHDALELVSTVAWKSSMGDSDVLKAMMLRSNLVSPPGQNPPQG